MRIKGQEFRKFISSVGSVIESYFDSTINDLIVSRSGLSIEEFVELQRAMLSSNVELNAIAASLFRVINITKGLNDGVIHATASMKGSPETVKKLKDEFDSWKGPMTESTIRQLVSEREGKVWAEARRFKSLDDVLFWIGRGIGATENEINHTRMKIVSALIFDSTLLVITSRRSVPLATSSIHYAVSSIRKPK